MFHIALFASLAVLLAPGATAKPQKKKKGSSDLTKLVEVQSKWKDFWNDAAVGVGKCKGNCAWKELKLREGALRAESIELIVLNPQFEASLDDFLKLSPRAAGKVEDHGMYCHVADAVTRDDYCICAKEVGDWETICSKAKNKLFCQAFLKHTCGVEFSLEAEADDEDLDNWDDVEDTMKRLDGKATDAATGQKETRSRTEEQLLRLQTALQNLDNERKQLYEVHTAAAKKKGDKATVRPLLSNLDQRIKRQKDKILRDMEELIDRREKEVKKEKEELDTYEKEHQTRLQGLLAEDKEM